MSHIYPSNNDPVFDMSTAAIAAMEHALCAAIQKADFVSCEQIIEAWVTRLSLPTHSPDRLSAARTVAFADRQGLPHLFAPACLAYVIETPLSSDIWPTGAVVSTFCPNPDTPLTENQRVRLLLGYYSMQSDWIRLRTAPHIPSQCSTKCLSSWLFQWSLNDQLFSGQANIVNRVKRLREDLLSTGRGAMGQFMSGECWSAAIEELDEVLESVESGSSFFCV
jgi:hypothetical protein